MNVSDIAPALTIGYLLGSVSFSHLLDGTSHEMKRLQDRGTGASTMYWAHGLRAALLVLLGDFVKGFVAAALARRFISEEAALLAGTSAVIGHNWPVFYRFKGGRGVATAVGVLLALAPAAMGLGIAIGAGAFGLTRNTLIAATAVFGGTVGMALGLGTTQAVLIYSMALPAVVAAYTLFARRHVPAIERWRSTSLKS